MTGDAEASGSERLRYWLGWAILPTDKNRVEGRFMAVSNGLELADGPYVTRTREQVDKLQRELGIDSRTLDTDNGREADG